MSCIAIIPARGGSTRIPKKNIKLFHGEPIIAYSIETAKKSNIFNRIIVSTDCFDIAEVANNYGAEVMMRHADFAKDEVGTQEVIRNALDTLEITEQYSPMYTCCLYATAPMLQPHTLRRAKMMLSPGVPYVVPVATWLRDPGQFYFGNTNAFKFGAALNTNRTQIIWIDPATECDINTPEDWERAKRIYKKPADKGSGAS